ncbi:MAG: LysR family transcriptional regulator [Azospirillaceae bacterium]|nr:LysR family transcriptional regulator [Azospirillaceae bacterium]
MEMQQLQHFLATARYGSVGRAAEALNLTQSGVSRSIRALERALGLPLFEREARGVTLTSYGESLAARARIICNEHARAMAEARAFRALKTGDLTLGLHTVFAHLGAADALDPFMAAYPDIQLSVSTGATFSLAAEVEDARLDLALTMFADGVRVPGLVYEELGTVACGIHARAAHPLAMLPGLNLADLAPHPWVLSGAVHLRQAFDAGFEAAGVAPPARVAQSASLTLLLDLVARRDLLTLVPDAIAAARGLVRLDISAPAGRPRAGLVYRADSLERPPVRAVVAQFRRLAATFLGGGDQTV